MTTPVPAAHPVTTPAPSAPAAAGAAEPTSGAGSDHAAAGHGHDHAHQFEDAGQQRESALLGMWVFLAGEMLFFGALFLAFTVYRVSHPREFVAAGRHTILLAGTINSCLLIVSSVTMSLAVRAAGAGNRRELVRMLLATAALGTLFFGIKCWEYSREIGEHFLPGSGFRFEEADPQKAQLFFYLYFTITGVHMLHLSIGIVLISLFALAAWRTRAFIPHDTPVELLGLYWHFVDVVWIFAYPTLYLINR